MQNSKDGEKKHIKSHHTVVSLRPCKRGDEGEGEGGQSQYDQLLLLRQID